MFGKKENNKKISSIKNKMCAIHIFFHFTRNSQRITNKYYYLMLDALTPHVDQKNHKTNLLKGPNVIKLLKVRPGIEFQFFFILNDYMVEDKESGERITSVTKEEKKNLFKNLLLFGGVGARTNVGFGQFSEKKDKTPQ